MDESVKRENVVFRVKQLLQNKGIKLWLPPYYEQGKDISDLGITDQILELAVQQYEILNIDPQVCAEILLDLQIKSLQRLKEREQFKTEGLATLRVKVSGQTIPEFSIQLKLSSLYDDLRKSISEQINISAERLKLIAAGKILKFDQNLEQQMIKHGSTVLVMVLPSVNDSPSTDVDNVDERILHETKKDLEFLTNKSNKSSLISVTDQAGHFLNIPESSRTSLLTAMTLHEKGRSAFKRGTYSLALVFYLEADNEFKSCKSDLLDKVDNYALLNLDIVWCYLHLQSFHYLSDAEARLKICDETFKRCYGSNLERVVALKGTSGNESVLLVRLHLLQAILHHLLNRKDAAVKMFEQVENEIQKLKVDEEKAVDLMTTLNCSLKEARLGLRASFNDANAAYEFILKQREQKKRSKTVEKLRTTTEYCICGNGACVDAETVLQLTEMGYSQMISIAALMITNNNLNGAIMWINNFSQNLRNLYPPLVADVVMSFDITSKKHLTIFRAHKYQLNEKCIADVVAASIGAEQAAELFPNFTSPVPSSSLSTQIPSTSQEATYQSICKAAEKVAKTFESDFVSEEEKNAHKRLKKDLSDTTDDYLDTTLESEEKFLAMYKSLLS